MTANTTAQPTTDWSTVATGWDTYRTMVEAAKVDLTTRMLDYLDLGSGDRVLELGAGTGDLARVLADQVGADGWVLASDVAAGMVELIEATNDDRPNVHAALIDASDIGPQDDPFDAVLFRMGLMFVPDPAVSLAEIRRVLKPAGRLALATWAGPEFNMWLVSIGMSAVLNGMLSGPLPTAPGGPLSLSDPDALVELARAAGFTDVVVEPVDISFRAADADAHIAHVTSLAPPLAAAYASASADQRAAFRASVEEMTKQFLTDDGLVIPGRALLLQAS